MNPNVENKMADFKRGDYSVLIPNRKVTEELMCSDIVRIKFDYLNLSKLLLS